MKFSEWLWNKTGLSFWCDWLQIFPIEEWNWINITFIHLDIEWDKFDNSFNLEAGLVGFNMRWQYRLPGDTRQSKDIKERIKQAEAQLAKE